MFKINQELNHVNSSFHTDDSKIKFRQKLSIVQNVLRGNGAMEAHVHYDYQKNIQQSQANYTLSSPTGISLWLWHNSDWLT